MQHLRPFLPILLAVGVISCNSSTLEKKNAPKADQSQTIPSEEKQVSLTLETKEAAPASELQNAGNEPASLADIERYYDVMQLRDQMKQLTEIMSQRIQQMMQESLSTLPDMTPEMIQESQEIYQKILSSMPTEELLQAMAPIYAKHFTKNDINTIIQFYSSPVGKKMVTETPAITQEAMQASVEIMQKYMKNSMEEVNQAVEKLRKLSEEAQAQKALKEEKTLEEQKALEEKQTQEQPKAATQQAAEESKPADQADQADQAVEEKAPVA